MEDLFIGRVLGLVAVSLDLPSTMTACFSQVMLLVLVLQATMMHSMYLMVESVSTY